LAPADAPGLVCGGEGGTALDEPVLWSAVLPSVVGLVAERSAWVTLVSVRAVEPLVDGIVVSVCWLVPCVVSDVLPAASTTAVGVAMRDAATMMACILLDMDVFLSTVRAVSRTTMWR